MDENTYFEERLEEQIKWYDGKSVGHQNVYKRWKYAQVILSASIPFLVGYVADFSKIGFIIGVFGVFITCIEGILTIGKHHENWIEYRSICETLRHEKYMYLTRTGVYKGEEPFKHLVERVETVISQENVNWAALNYEKNKHNGGNKDD